MLGSRALRQIGQRVSVSYYIKPLTYEETCAYIYHRMSIASRGIQTHFTSSALKRIYKYSSGIPRMINIACDKTLFTAHRLNQGHITGDIAQTALTGLAAGSDRRGLGLLIRYRALAVAVGCCLLLVLMLTLFYPWQADRPSVGLKTETQPVATGLTDNSNVTSPNAPEAQEPISKVGHPVVVEPSKVTEPEEGANSAAVNNLPVAEQGAERQEDPAPSLSVTAKPLKPVAKMTHSVQVGAFRRMPLARKLAGTLKQKGYPASILPVYDSQNRPWFTVRIGDYPSRDAAIQRANEFTSRENMASAVRPFERL